MPTTSTWSRGESSPAAMAFCRLLATWICNASGVWSPDCSIDHIVDQCQNTRFKFCDHLNSSLILSALITDRLARETVLTSVQACHKSPPERR